MPICLHLERSVCECCGEDEQGISHSGKNSFADFKARLQSHESRAVESKVQYLYFKSSGAKVSQINEYS